MTWMTQTTQTLLIRSPRSASLYMNTLWCEQHNIRLITLAALSECDFLSGRDHSDNTQLFRFHNEIEIEHGKFTKINRNNTNTALASSLANTQMSFYIVGRRNITYLKLMINISVMLAIVPQQAKRLDN
jgi:hypothetical protein